MRNATARSLMVTTAACFLAACGGGGGGGSGIVSTPPPPPPPPVPTFPIIFPAITQTTDFALLGYEVPDGFAATPTLTGDGFAVRYDAAEGAYIMDVPSASPGKFQSNLEDADSWSGGITGTSVNMDVAKPTAINRDPDFEFTSFATYYQYDFHIPNFYGAMAFGSATPSAAIPTTGSAVYDAIVAGFTLDSGMPIGGTASLQFDFGTGTLGGAFNPIFNPNGGSTAASLGTYTFVNTVFGAGSTTFSGSLQRSGITELGTFNGLFTGPAAQELMARWKAPYINPTSKAQSEIFGVWIGRKP